MSKTTKYTTPWATILTMVFVTLKLTDNVDWSWFWVFSPLWICVGTALIALALMVAVGDTPAADKAKTS